MISWLLGLSLRAFLPSMWPQTWGGIMPPPPAPEPVPDPGPIVARILLIAGGGSGGMYANGAGFGASGGGAGGVLDFNATLPKGSSYAITIGAGGVRGTPGVDNGNGGNSTIAGPGVGMTAIGGGQGSDHEYHLVGTAGTGNAGGSGGGGNTGPGASLSGQGNNGGWGNHSTGGGGGAGGKPWSFGELGYPTDPHEKARGGLGLLSNITGVDVYYAAGGGGANGYGGIGGGGQGAWSDYETDSGGTPATAPTSYGSGGGGGEFTDGVVVGTLLPPSNGYQGVCILRYFGTPRATGGTITQVGGFTIHTFAAGGTFAVNP